MVNYVRCKTKLHKFLLISGALMLIGVLTIIGINLFMVGYSQQYTYPADEVSKLTDVDCIMVLGCGVYNDRPTPLLEDRLKRGVAVHETGVSAKILMSGDHGQADYDEVNIMKQYALDAGISADDIFMDHAGFSTYESVCRAKEIFGVDKMVIVTQKYHLSRAVFLARMLGIDAYGVASDYRSFGGQFYRDCREVLARVKDLFTAIIQPSPTYLGEAIPINGSGTLTNG